MARGQLSTAREEIGAWCAVHGGDPAALLADARRKHRALRRHRFVPGYSVASRLRLRADRSRRATLAPELLRHLPAPSDALEGTLSDSLMRSTCAGTLPFYLRLEDRNSMAHGVEGRVPFLDHRLVELAFTLPESWLVRGPWNKYVLREALRGRAPDVVRERTDKFGFPHPARSWFTGPLADRVADVFAAPVAADLYDVAWARRLVAEHRGGDADHAATLLRLVQLERWMATVVNGSTAARPVAAPAVQLSA